MADLRCIFCKRGSGASKSREHIVPESLGNTTIILPPGVVCDTCNNYFSRKIEEPFLNSNAIKRLRFMQMLPSKRGRVPAASGFLTTGNSASIHLTPKSPIFAGVLDIEGDLSAFLNSKDKEMFIFNQQVPDDYVVSRFLAKAGVEYVAYQYLKGPGDYERIVYEPALEAIKDHARSGKVSEWPFNVRRIYDENRSFLDDKGSCVQTVHEMDFLVLNDVDVIYVLALFGLEFAINLGRSDITPYRKWLSLNSDASPLYHGKNAPK